MKNHNTSVKNKREKTNIIESNKYNKHSRHIEQKPTSIIITQSNRNKLICVNADTIKQSTLYIVRKSKERSRNFFILCESECTDDVVEIDMMY